MALITRLCTEATRCGAEGEHGKAQERIEEAARVFARHFEHVKAARPLGELIEQSREALARLAQVPHREPPPPHPEAVQAKNDEERGDELLAGGDWQEAVRYYGRAADFHRTMAHPFAGRLHLKLGVAHLEGGEREAALAEYDRAVSCDWLTDEDVRTGMRAVMMGLYWAKVAGLREASGDSEGAWAAYEKAFASGLNPRDSSKTVGVSGVACVEAQARLADRIAAERRKGTRRED